MTRSKKLFILLGVLAAACLITFIASRYKEHVEQISNAEEIVMELNTEEVTALSWEYDETAFSFVNDGGTWVYEDDKTFPVDAEKITKLLSLFAEFKAAFTIKEVEDYSMYGLSEPTCTINISTGDETIEIKLGDYSVMDEERYVSIGDQSDGLVYLAAVDPLDDFDTDINELILNDEIPSLSKTTAIYFDGEESYRVFYEEDSDSTYNEEDVYFVDGSATDLPLDTSLVKSYLSVISGLDLSNYVTYNASATDLSAYGLDSPELAVTVQYAETDEETEEEISKEITIYISRDPKQAAESVEDEDEDAAEAETDTDEEDSADEIIAYLRVGDSEIIYQITGTEYTNLMASSYNDLRHQEIFSGSFDNVYRIDIQLDDEIYILTKVEDEEEGESAWYFNEDEFDITAISSAISALTADAFTDESATDKEEIHLTIYMDNENFPEVSIALYRYDGTYCLAILDGEPVAFVERSLVVDLVEAVNTIVLN